VSCASSEPMRRCPQCWQMRPLSLFRSRKDPERIVRWCLICRDHYAQPNPPPRSWRGGDHDSAPLRVQLVLSSGNRKIGPIPCSTSSPCTCPPSCPWYGDGCYSEYHNAGGHWKRAAQFGMSWQRFCEAVGDFSPGTFWRHNTAGDLPGVGERIDAEQLRFLCSASSHTAGFTYTHKPLTAKNRRLIREANGRSGLVLNLSADGVHQVDRLVSYGCGPVAVVLPQDSPVEQRTQEGRRIVVCPAQRTSITCDRCRLCIDRTREVVVGFWAHGPAKKRISERLREQI